MKKLEKSYRPSKANLSADYKYFDNLILADGTPAGFSTAVLEEVSKRIGKNIELISIDSGARTSILSSKGADVVFWVSVPKDSTLIPANIDLPAGIAISEPYYNDNIVYIGNKWFFLDGGKFSAKLYNEMEIPTYKL